MRLYIITYSYPPENSVFTPDLADIFIKSGYNVTIFAPFPNRPEGNLYPGFKRKWRSVSKEDGCHIIRSWHTLSKKSRMLSRFLENITFGLTSSLNLIYYLIKEPKPDVVFMKAWPIFAQSMNSFVLKLFRIPIVCSVLDIYPEGIIDNGTIKRNGIIAKLMRIIDTFHLKRCSKIFTLSPGMRKLLIETRNLSEDKVVYIPNYADSGPFENKIDKGIFRRKHNIDDKMLIGMFAGTLTLTAGLMIYVKAAELLRNYNDILILLVGEGTMRVELEKVIKERNLENIRVIHPFIPSEVAEVQAAADVLLLSLTGNMSNSAAPSKQVYYLLSGKHIIANVPADSFPAYVIDEAKAGFILPPDDHKRLAEKLLEVKEQKQMLVDMALIGKDYAIKHFTRDVVLPQLVGLIDSAAKVNKQARK